jgi:hypothetical protein
VREHVKTQKVEVIVMADVNQNPNNETENANVEDVNTSQQESGNGDTENKQEVTIESLMAEIAQLKADGARNKTALDKALREKGEITKALRAKQTAEEQEAEAKKEAEERQKAYIDDLEKFKKTAEAKARYALQGMNEELAVKAAEAEISGDMDALATIQNEYRQISIKQEVAKELKNMPQINAGTGGQQEDDDAFLKGFNSVAPRFNTK